MQYIEITIKIAIYKMYNMSKIKQNRSEYHNIRASTIYIKKITYIPHE